MLFDSFLENTSLTTHWMKKDNLSVFFEEKRFYVKWICLNKTKVMLFFDMKYKWNKEESIKTGFFDQRNVFVVFQRKTIYMEENSSEWIFTYLSLIKWLNKKRVRCHFISMDILSIDKNKKREILSFWRYSK
jgi:hypothetical protein